VPAVPPSLSEPEPHRSRLPALGGRGEGWVVGQGILLGLVALLGLPGLATLPPADAGRWASVAIGLALLVGGCLIGLAGARELGRSLTAVPRPKQGARFVDTGIYHRVRHPLYLAVVSVALGWSVAMASPAAGAAAVALAIWLDLKSRREEAWLCEAYLDYPAYRRRTDRFVPGLY
jgi:protein-S-isoprenylcysteine O-methyltransferase Ste14